MHVNWNFLHNLSLFIFEFVFDFLDLVLYYINEVVLDTVGYLVFYDIVTSEDT